MMRHRGYTGPEKEMIRWLSKEDSSALGECFGTTLWALVGEGLAEVKPIEDAAWPYARVSLTPDGWAALKQIAPTG